MWQPLGVVTPTFDLWLPFPNQETGVGTVFRLQFISDGNVENVFSQLWFRRVWSPGTFKDKEVEPSQRLYPQEHSVILWLPIPPPMELAGITPYMYEVKKSKYTRKGNYFEPDWYVSLDVLEGGEYSPNADNQQDIENIDLQLNDINFQPILDKLNDLQL